jgi:hypothetical protein
MLQGVQVPDAVAGITGLSSTADAIGPDRPPAGPSRTLRGKALVAVRILVTLAIAAGIGYATVGSWRDVKSTILGLAWQSVLLSLVAALLGYAANTLGWRAALADMEFRASVPATARIYLVGQLAKYLPGGVWAYVLQMELGRRAGLPRARAFLASIVATGLSITAGLVVGMFGLRALFDAAHTSSSGTVALYVVIGIVPVALVCSHPRVLPALVQLFLKLVRRKPLRHELSWPGVLKVIGFSGLAFVFFGLHLWLLTNMEAEPGARGVLTCIGAFALALIAGTFVVISPSGLGAREAVLTAALSAFMPAGVALGVALASRLVFTAADVIAAGGAALWSWRILRRKPEPEVAYTP